MLAAHGHHRLRSPHARPSQRRAPFPTFRHSCAASVAPPPSFLRPPSVIPAHPSVIPAEAGIQAICAGQGHSQCSTAPDHPRGSGGPSAGWRLVARLGGRMDSCLRRNDGQGGCDGGVIPRCTLDQLRRAFPPLRIRHSCGGRNPGDLMRVKGTPNVRRRPITRGALVGRRPDGGSSHGWAVAWIPASAEMTDRAGVTEGVEE